MNSFSIFGGTKIGQRPWRPGKKLWSFVLFAGCDMDFRQAELEEGETRVTAISVFGGHKIIVPPNIPVSLSGFSCLGGREMKRTQVKEPSISTKTLHVVAISIIGGLEVSD